MSRVKTAIVRALNKRTELARQLWFWQSRDIEGAEHERVFEGRTTYSETDWNELLIEEERESWLKRADCVLALLTSHVKTTVVKTTIVRGARDGQYTAGTGLLTRKIRALGAEVMVASTGRVTVIDKTGAKHVYVLELYRDANTSPLRQALADLESAS